MFVFFSSSLQHESCEVVTDLQFCSVVEMLNSDCRSGVIITQHSEGRKNRFLFVTMMIKFNMTHHVINIPFSFRTAQNTIFVALKLSCELPSDIQRFRGGEL